MIKRLLDRMNANCTRIGELAELVKRENRALTAAEQAEYDSLKRDNEYVEMKLRSLRMPQTGAAGTSLTQQVRANLQKNLRTEYITRRDQTAADGASEMVYTGVADVQAGGAEPIKIEDVVKPLYEGLILNLLGIDMRTGLSGEYVWPVVEAVTVKVAGEAVELGKQKLDMSKISARPERIGASMSLTRQSIIQSDGLAEYLVTSLLPEALAAGMNKLMFSVDKVLETTDNLKGPFVDLKGGAVALKSLSYKEFCKMKAQVLKSGVSGRALAFVMTKSTAAELEGTPRDTGSGLMILEDGKICGIPVFTTEAIGDDYIGLGDWIYQVLGMFGDIAFIVDPYSDAGSDIINFHLNANYGTATLRKEAFVLSKTPA